MKIQLLVYEISIVHEHRGHRSKMAKLQYLCQYCIVISQKSQVISHKSQIISHKSEDTSQKCPPGLPYKRVWPQVIQQLHSIIINSLIFPSIMEIFVGYF